MRNKMIELIREAKGTFRIEEMYADIDSIIDMPSEDEYLADHLIANGATIQQWIPVFKPPKEDGSHLVYDYIGGVSVAHYWAQGDTWTDTWGFGLHPMYWNTMPLPEPPKEEV